MKKILLIVAPLFFLLGCGPDYKAKVESNTSWSGSFGNRTVDGRNNQTVDLPDEDPQCCVVQKQTENGFLKVTVIDEGGGLFGGTDGESGETTAKYGVVSVCSK